MALTREQQKELNYKLSEACDNGRLQSVKRYIEKGAQANHQDIVGLAANGHLNIIKYLHQNGLELYLGYDSEAVPAAAAYGHLKVVKFLHQNGVYIDRALEAAAYAGHLDVAKYLIENGVDVHNNEDGAIRCAARKGHLEVVKYLLKNGADNKNAVIAASIEGHLDIVKYLVENGNDLSEYGYAAIKWAAREEHIEVVKYLHQNGVSLDLAIEEADDDIKEELIAYKEKLLMQKDLSNLQLKPSSPK